MAVTILWLIYLVPAWLQRRRYMATERQVTRMQQALRVMTETSAEGSHLVEAELNARKVAIVAREARRQRRLALRAEKARAQDATREFARVERIRSEEQREIARMSADIESARLRTAGQMHRTELRNTLEYRAASLRRGRLVSTGVTGIGLLVALVGAILAPSTLAGWWVLVLGVALVFAGVSMLKAAARTARAYRARGTVVSSARAAAGGRQGLSPEDMSVVSASGVAEQEPVREAGERREWTPQRLPQPLSVTREEILAAARAEAAAVEAAEAAGAAGIADVEVSSGSEVLEASEAGVLETAVSVEVETEAGTAASGGFVAVASTDAGADVSEAREKLRQASDDAVAALRAAEFDDPAVAPIESALAGAEDFGWLTALEDETAAAAAQNTSSLDEVLQRRRNAG